MGFVRRNAIALVALVFAMTGTGIAANGYLINSTKQINPKVLKALRGKVGPAGKQGLQGKEGAAGHDGAPGLAGAPGQAGKEGAEGKGGAGTTLWAVVATDGSLKKGSGVESSKEFEGEKGFEGKYEVVFNRDVSGCAYEATLGSAGGGEAESVGEIGAGEIIAEPSESKATGVFVETFGNGEFPREKPFHLVVFC